MTVIVGVAERGRVVMGGDCAGVSGYDLTHRRDPKLFLAGPYVVGFSYSFRMGQVLRHVFKPPPPPKRKGLIERFMVVDFVDALRGALKSSGWARVKDGGQEEGGCFLVGVEGRLFTVSPDYQVGESASGWDAIGCGGEVARGALFATPRLKPESRVRLALRAAERCNAAVRGPFTILTIGG